MNNQTLTIQIYSFGFQKSGIPPDPTGNHGGFIFDCRFLPNPGREEKYTKLTGYDSEVIEYFHSHPQVETFLNHVFAIVDAAVANYQSRHFNHLLIAFGCTGGQHRSVYCANRLADHLDDSGAQIRLQHIDLPIKSV